MNLFSYINLRPSEYKVSPLMCPDFSQQSITWDHQTASSCAECWEQAQGCGTGAQDACLYQGQGRLRPHVRLYCLGQRGRSCLSQKPGEERKQAPVVTPGFRGAPQTLHYRTRGAWPVEPCVRVQIAPHAQQYLLLSVIFTRPILGVKWYLIVVLIAFP